MIIYKIIENEIRQLETRKLAIKSTNIFTPDLTVCYDDGDGGKKCYGCELLLVSLLTYYKS